MEEGEMASGGLSAMRRWRSSKIVQCVNMQKMI